MFSIIKSGMDTALQELSTISNNISNANSTGFKKTSVMFSEFYNGRTPHGVESALVQERFQPHAEFYRCKTLKT